MRPALRKGSKFWLVSTLLVCFSSSSPAQSPPVRSISEATARTPVPQSSDPTADELLAMGREGEVIAQARAQVLVMLAESSSCSNWFRSADPEALDKFRSLRYDVDASGAWAIVKFEGWRDDTNYYQPYVARTGQNVGRGSTITFNLNGAFFKNSAPVRSDAQLAGGGNFVSFRALHVGGYTGATLQARLLTLLHELGHTLDLLPLDAGVPLGPQLSVQNTERVLHYCKPQIEARTKLLRSARTASRDAKVQMLPVATLVKQPEYPDIAPWLSLSNALRNRELRARP